MKRLGFLMLAGLLAWGWAGLAQRCAELEAERARRSAEIERVLR